MDQQTCLSSPHHYTHYGVCYEGNPTFQMHSISTGSDTSWITKSAPEPDTLAMLLLGLGFLVARYRRR